VANFLFNNAKGQFRHWIRNVDANDPADAKILLVPLSASDTEANAQDADTLTAALATAMNEQTGGGWVRKTLTDADFAATDYDVNDTDNRGDASLPSVTWTAPTAGNDTTGLLVCYTEVASPADTDWIPISHHDFVVETDGNDVVLNAGDFARAS
jgi:hypothetical protein